ncbi:mucin-4-like [Daktulosphaira vitifoliae]|uniref:mucin-4-like n=1 Tax=Daktulosphaira vitifoliae TaxID=58002 RepID=UPI0021AA27C7|nr:mucin-4-like [Daktulosphaira vitifoliae]
MLTDEIQNKMFYFKLSVVILLTILIKTRCEPINQFKRSSMPLISPSEAVLSLLSSNPMLLSYIQNNSIKNDPLPCSTVDQLSNDKTFITLKYLLSNQSGPLTLSSISSYFPRLPLSSKLKLLTKIKLLKSAFSGITPLLNENFVTASSDIKSQLKIPTTESTHSSEASLTPDLKSKIFEQLITALRSTLTQIFETKIYSQPCLSTLMTLPSIESTTFTNQNSNPDILKSVIPILNSAIKSPSNSPTSCPLLQQKAPLPILPQISSYQATNIKPAVLNYLSSQCSSQLSTPLPINKNDELIPNTPVLSSLSTDSSCSENFLIKYLNTLRTNMNLQNNLLHTLETTSTNQINPPSIHSLTEHSTQNKYPNTLQSDCNGKTSSSIESQISSPNSNSSIVNDTDLLNFESYIPNHVIQSLVHSESDQTFNKYSSKELIPISISPNQDFTNTKSSYLSQNPLTKEEALSSHLNSNSFLTSKNQNPETTIQSTNYSPSLSLPDVSCQMPEYKIMKDSYSSSLIQPKLTPLFTPDSIQDSATSTSSKLPCSLLSVNSEFKSDTSKLQKTPLQQDFNYKNFSLDSQSFDSSELQKNGLNDFDSLFPLTKHCNSSTTSQTDLVKLILNLLNHSLPLQNSPCESHSKYNLSSNLTSKVLEKTSSSSKLSPSSPIFQSKQTDFPNSIANNHYYVDDKSESPQFIHHNSILVPDSSSQSLTSPPVLSQFLNSKPLFNSNSDLLKYVLSLPSPSDTTPSKKTCTSSDLLLTDTSFTTENKTEPNSQSDVSYSKSLLNSMSEIKLDYNIKS